MRAKLKDILLHGMTFLYEYDFGSTTELTLKVLERGISKARGGPVRLLARNGEIVFSCVKCGKLATMLCLECQEEVGGPEDEENVFFCDRCIDKASHSHDKEMRIPVVNSPRMGVCGYTGE